MCIRDRARFGVKPSTSRPGMPDAKAVLAQNEHLFDTCGISGRTQPSVDVQEGMMPKLKRSPDDTRNTDVIESLDRGLRVFELFGADPRPMTLSDLAKAADLPRATARRILFTLERAGYVASDGKLFTLTPRVLALAG